MVLIKKEIIIRFALDTDTPLILQFIKELAEYQKLLHEVIATEETLKNRLFGDKKYAEVILMYVDNNPVGFALFFHNFSTFLGKAGIYLEDLYVIPEARGFGVAKKALAFLANIAIERDCGRLDWSVLDWNTHAIEFYRKIGATPMDEWTTQRITSQELHNLAKLC